MAINPLVRTARRYMEHRLEQWRTGSDEGQMPFLVSLLVIVLAMTAISLVHYQYVPAATFVLPLVAGGLFLRWKAYAVLALVTITGAGIGCVRVSMLTEFSTARLTTFLTVLAVGLLTLYTVSRHSSGLPGTLSENMLVDLRNRLQSQGAVPTLPRPWHAQVAMRSANDARFAGDFLITNLSDDARRLELVLVDVCGKGVAAGTRSLQLAGALGGLIGSLPPLGLFAATNDFLLRQRWDEGFATAVHVSINLSSGHYSIINAGHPPAMHWVAAESRWEPDEAHGLALGIANRPEFYQTSGVLASGDALMFYTDGLIETRGRELSDGIDWLQDIARTEVMDGFEGAADRILNYVTDVDDDRALLILSQ